VVSRVLPLALRLAGRELRGGARGFRVFLACLALGVAAIAAAGSTAQAFRAGLAAQARQILGGDLSVSVNLRPFNAGERATFARLGAVDYAASVNAMAQAPSGDRRLVELRGVSGPFPLVGQVELSGARNLAQALSPVGDAAGAAVEKPLLDRLNLKLGDRFLVGNTPVVIRAILVSEPDQLSRGFALGPRVLVRMATVENAGFLTAGIPFGDTARIALPPGVPLGQAKARLKAALTADGAPADWRIEDRSNAAPGLARLIDQLEFFLGFIGLASLVAGGLGVQVAVSAHLEARKTSIAVLKALGAEGALARNVYLIQIGVLALAGVGLGLIVGGAAPLILGALIQNSLPVPALFALYPEPLVRAGAFGLLAAAAFSLGPLARARATPPAALFRRQMSARPAFSLELVGALIAAILLALLAIATAPTPLAAAVMIGGVILAFGLLWALGAGAAWGAGRLRGLTRGAARLGLANLAGPGSAARNAAPAIGLGVALLSAVVLIQSSLLTQVAQVAPRTAPSLIFTGLSEDQGPRFQAEVAQGFGRPLTRETWLMAPFFTGRITAIRGRPIAQTRIDPGKRWAYDRDLGMSVLGPAPINAGVIKGHWWAADYAGPPLAAISADIAQGANLKLGDVITIDVLGRAIDARVAVIRRVDLAGFGAGFPVVLDPAALAGADLKLIAIAKASPAEERRVTLALGRDFPQVNVISVREALASAADLFARLALAIRAAAAVAALAGLLVLTGAIAARAQARAREAAVLKVLGASRAQILTAYALEYGAVGLIAGIAGVALGVAAAWPIVTGVFEASWSLDWRGAGALILAAALLATVGGAAAAFWALRRRPAAVLREG
jgi:putative ABC transport system permease protein